jgi:hypothetical protein
LAAQATQPILSDIHSHCTFTQSTGWQLLTGLSTAIFWTGRKTRGNLLGTDDRFHRIRERSSIQKREKQ